MITRRGLVTGLVGLIAAPVIAKVSSLMPLRGESMLPIDAPVKTFHVGYCMITRTNNYNKITCSVTVKCINPEKFAEITKRTKSKWFSVIDAKPVSAHPDGPDLELQVQG